ncbi:UTP--glucose-1-phosphate uridylyltransferase, partial [Candidatus Saccharibacteria bacterium]|nr:UTP--glucose-1-phosphate uridylyltransferase [Candidatus Saccharibacteria bacterium]
KVVGPEISSYGVASVENFIDDVSVKINGLVEKPTLDEAPSDLAIASGYLLTPDVLSILEQEKVGPDGEIRISDAVDELCTVQDVYGRIIDGDYHDTGTPERYIQTVIDIALADDKLGPDLREHLRNKL